MQSVLTTIKSDIGVTVPKIESILNDNRLLSSFAFLLKMRDEKTQLVSDCLMQQWSGESVIAKDGKKSKKSGSRFNGLFEQVKSGCLIPSCQAVSLIIQKFTS
jgi:hypothetical protein